MGKKVTRVINVYRVEPRENLKNKKNNRNQLVSQKRKKKHTPTTQERNRETHNTSISFNSISLDLSFFLSGALFCFLIILARWKEVENARVCVCVDLIMTVRQDKHWIGRMYIYQMPSAAAAAAAWWCHSSSWGRQQPPPEKSYPATWEIHLGDLAEQTPWLFSSLLRAGSSSSQGCLGGESFANAPDWPSVARNYMGWA